MSEQENSHPMSRFIILTAALAFIIWGISQAQAVLVSVLVSVFLAILSTPLVRWLERKRMPGFVAGGLVIACMVLFLLVIGAVIGASITSFYASLPQYQARFQEQMMALKGLLATKGITPPNEIFLKYLNPSSVLNWTVSLLMGVGSAFSNIFLILLTVTFILLEASSFPIKLRAVLGDPNLAFPQFTKFIDDMKRYMVIKTLVSLGTGLLVTLWLSVLHVDFPILWGFLAFLLNFVPSIGSSLAGIPAVLLAFIQLGFWRAILAAAGYMVINLVLDYGIETRLMGQKLGLSTLVVFLSLVFWGSLLGPVGAVLCIPLSLTLKFAFASQESTRWVAVLLGPEDMAGRLE